MIDTASRVNPEDVIDIKDEMERSEGPVKSAFVKTEDVEGSTSPAAGGVGGGGGENTLPTEAEKGQTQVGVGVGSARDNSGGDKCQHQRDDNNNKDTVTPTHRVTSRATSGISEKYGLRPRTLNRRLQVEKKQQEEQRAAPRMPPARPCRKARPPPLSKYRRKTANARERHRMKEINDAFETLRKMLPTFNPRRTVTGMTKITTLRLAVNYIKALARVLQDGDAGDVSLFDGISLDELHPLLAELEEFSPATPMEVAGVVQSPPPSAYPDDSSPAQTPAHALLRPPMHIGNVSVAMSEFLADDSCVFVADDLDPFEDIQTLCGSDALALLFSSDTVVI